MDSLFSPRVSSSSAIGPRPSEPLSITIGQSVKPASSTVSLKSQNKHHTLSFDEHGHVLFPRLDLSRVVHSQEFYTSSASIIDLTPGRTPKGGQANATNVKPGKREPDKDSFAPHPADYYQILVPKDLADLMATGSPRARLRKVVEDALASDSELRQPLTKDREDLANKIVNCLIKNGANTFNQVLEYHATDPLVLRVFAFFAGLSLTVVSTFNVLRVLAALWNPTDTILHAYLGTFGILVMMIEVRECYGVTWLGDCLSVWAKFLTVAGGKGCAYFFVGTLAASYCLQNPFNLLSGGFLMFIGGISILLHCWEKFCTWKFSDLVKK